MARESVQTWVRKFKLMWNYQEIRGLRQSTLCSSTGSADVLVGNKW